MTYSLHTLTAPTTGGPTPNRSGIARFADELTLLAGLVGLVLWLLSLTTFSLLDAAWSSSGTGAPVFNQLGSLGAWIADGSYFLLGFSVWWCVAAAVRVWLSALARWLRGHDMMVVGHGPNPPARRSSWFNKRVKFWLGLVLLVVASSVLEWTR